MFEAVGRGGQRINVWPAKELVLVFTGGGFEPGDLATFILRALKSDEPLPPNIAAATKLKAKIHSAARPPPPQPAPRLPALAAGISRKAYKLSPNTLGLSTLVLDFNG